MAKSRRDSRRNQQSIDYEEDMTKSMGVIGLYYLGNTCYLNSVLQNLIYLRSFRDQLIHTMNRTEYKFVPKKHPYLETKIFSYSGEKAEPGRLTKELFNLIKETAYENYSRKRLTPKMATSRAMRDEFAKKHEKFSDGSQQDSHELFRSLINVMKEEEIHRLKEAFLDCFGINVHKTKSHNCSGDENRLKMDYASEFENSSLLTGTFIDDTFGGEMISVVKCEGCGNVLKVHEDFLDISLHLSADSKEVHNKDSLEFYLEQFFSPKFLEKDYICNSCNPQLVSKQDEASYTNSSSDGDKNKKEDETDSIDYGALIYTNAVKRFRIKTVGPVLTIHLKRFSQTGYGLQKLIKHVEFPLVLDMSPFCVSDTSVRKDCNNQILYGLRGMVAHSGETVAKDDVAYVNIADWNVPPEITNKDNKTVGKRPNSHPKHVKPIEDWYYISDSYISKTYHDQVFSSQAYILFYERLPLVTRDGVEEEIDKNNNSELCGTRNYAAKIQEKPTPSLGQSYIQFDDRSIGNRTKSMRVIGLSNLGNTCYFNSILQNLLYLRPFRDQLIHTMNRTEYKLVPKKHPYLETLTFSYSGKKAETGKLTKELFNLIKETAYEKSSRKWFTPKMVASRAMRDEFAKIHERISAGSQQDSHELFRSLISMLKEEEIKRLKEAFFDCFGINVHKTKSHNCSGDEKKLKMEYASEFENSSLLTGTFIDNTYGGEMISVVKCEGCGNVLNVHEDFLDISLHLSAVSKEVHNKDSLEFYLEQFFSPKFLEKDYICNSCNPQLVSKQDEASDTNSSSDGDKNKKEDETDSIDYDDLIYTNAVKRFRIKTVGPVLTIHLKRFSQTGYDLKKLNKHVEFPLVLDMSPFCVSDTSVRKDCNNQILYGLRGMVAHSGEIVAKDDVAYVNIADWNVPAEITNKDNKTVGKRPNSHPKHVKPTEDWYYISDSYISRINHDQVFSSQTYILFYERLPLVPRDGVEEEIDKNNNSELCGTRNYAAKIQEKPTPSLGQSYIQFDDRSIGNRTKSMRVIGLSNLGNTCYFNSILQNLLYLRPFRDQLIHTMNRTEYKLVPKKHPYLETKTFSYSGKKAETGKLTKELFNLIKETAYEKSSRKWFTPKMVASRAMRDEFAKIHERISAGSQQDSHELFRSLISMLKEEEIKRLKEAFFDCFGINVHKTKSHNCSGDEKKLKMEYASEFENSSLLTGTFIDNTYGGEMISVVKCEGCGNVLNVHEDFLDISLHLSAVSKEVHNKDSLEFYLEQFFSPKFLEKDYICNSCNPQLVSKQDEASDTNSSSDGDKNKKEDETDSIDYDDLIYTNAVKRFRIKTVGPVLTIHLKRFSQTGYDLKKLNKHVEFPLVLDMSPFCVSDTSVRKDCNNQILYGLRGMVAHSGEIVAKDDVAYVNIADWNVPAEITNKDNKTVGKRPNSHPKHVKPTEDWYYISDSYISRINHDQVFSSQTYILFYERLPLVPRDGVEEEIDKNNNSELCGTRNYAAKIQEKPNPSLGQSYIQSNDRSKVSRTKSMRVIGLQNLWNTSYLNSVLQNLLYLRPFRDQLIYTMNRTEYKLVPKKHPDLGTLTFAYSDEKTEPGKLTIGLFELIKETITEQSSRTIVTSNIFMPWAVQNEIADKSGRFSGCSQQDSHELFRFLIDMVKDEERQRLKTAFFYHFDINGNYTKLNNYSDLDSKKLLEKYASEFENCFVFNGTFIDDTFGGNMTSRVECLKCEEIISLNEVFLDISLPLEGTIKHKNNSLECYLKHFFSPKFLEKNYVCNNCNPQLVSKQDKASHTNTKSNEDKDEMKDNTECNDLTTLKFTDANKQFRINSLAPVLTIHLKRFYQSKHDLQKLDKHVHFPLVLDMSPFCASDTSILKDCDGKILYGLRGIVDHTSGIRTGHCMAYVNLADWDVPSKITCKDNTKSRTTEESSERIYSTYEPMDAVPVQQNEENKLPQALESNLCRHVEFTEEWYFISDSYYHETDRYHVLNSQAYILFYERLPLVEGCTLL